MTEYQKVIRGRDSLNNLPRLMEKLGMSRPMIVGMEPLTGTLLKRNPALLASSISFTTAPCVESAELNIIRPSGYSA